MLPRALKSFEAIDKVLTTKRDWKGQERAYRDMIKRMPKRRRRPMFHKLQVGLFDGLGEIYRSRLKHYQSATQAFEVAQQLDPKNEMRADGTDRAEILAELYLVAGPDYTDKAVEQHMRDAAQRAVQVRLVQGAAPASTWTRTSTTRPGASATRSRS